MKTKIFLIGLFGFIGPTWLSASESLSAEQILHLMEASRSRYLNLEATIKEKTFQKTTNSPNLELQGTTNFTIRETPERRYLYMDMRTVQDQSIDKTDQYVITSLSAKRLSVERKSNRPLGLLDRPENLNGVIHVHSVCDALWGLQNIPWKKIHQRIHTASITEDRGILILEYYFSDSGKSTGLRIWIDPEKGYVPISYATIFQDKTILSRVDSKDWEKISDLWIPMSYTYLAPTYGFRQEFEVQSILLNQPIAAGQMDFDFPEGTTVDDRLRGIKYQVPKANSPRASSAVEAISPFAAPVGDAELTSVAIKSDEMMAQQKTTTQTQTGISLSPPYIWVLPGKNQYTLELTKDTKARPSLSGKTISDSPLVLGSVDNQLAVSGKIIVTLERPEGHKAFADAVLTLDFAGTKVPIHFVAAPLP